MSRFMTSEMLAVWVMVMVILLTAWGSAWGMFVASSLCLAGGLLFAKRGTRAVLAMIAAFAFALGVAFLMRMWLG